MACDIHAEPNNEDGKCPSCLAGSPPDLGLEIHEEIQAKEQIS